MAELSPNQDIDLSLLYEIADGSDEFIVESIDMFMQQTPELLEEINNDIAAKDWLNAGLAAHKLKATLGFFGMLNSQSLIQDIELSCKAGTPVPADITAKFNQAQALVALNYKILATLRAETKARI
jgi:HPt (histidine-containing phosphotransfer) domain-containing protein